LLFHAASSNYRALRLYQGTGPSPVPAAESHPDKAVLYKFTQNAAKVMQKKGNFKLFICQDLFGRNYAFL